jgi:hypothetical protein
MIIDSYIDDPTISDETELWRRIPPWHFFHDENLGRIRPSSAAFENHPDGSPMSVLLATEGGTPETYWPVMKGLRWQQLRLDWRGSAGRASHVTLCPRSSHMLWYLVRSLRASVKNSQWDQSGLFHHQTHDLMQSYAICSCHERSMPSGKK